MISSDKLLLLIFLAVALILVAESQRTKLLKDEKNEMGLLNSINKPAIKSFQTEHGDILDCIDIHKQLAFDHPLLKNHSIQLRPTVIPKRAINNNNSQKGGSLPFRQDGISCPLGTVIVKRTTLEDLIQAQRLKSMWLKYSRYVSSKSKNIDLAGFHFAVAQLENLLETHIPKYLSGEPMAEQESQSLFTYWTADGLRKTGCYNSLCPGFVQVKTDIPLGYLIQPFSTYDGIQYELPINMYKNGTTGNWWLVAFDSYIGYWPNSLFTDTGLGHGANVASWGGEVYSPVKEKSPSMGSGHFPKEGYKKAAYVNGIEVVDDIRYEAQSPPIYYLKTLSKTPNCYKAIKKPDFGEVWADAIFYGGPGGCTF